jgi:trehalose/maltose transport system permease protein
MVEAPNHLDRLRTRTAWRFLAPALLVLALAAGWPLARTVLYGFTDAWLGDPESGAWIGFENYLARHDGLWTGLLADPQWWRAAANTLLFASVSVALETVLGVAIALVLNADFPGRALVRAAVLVPWAIPTVVSAKMWGWMLNDQFGVINQALLALGAIGAPLAWTADPRLALPTVILVDVWKTTPFMALLALAALQLVPKECYESARVDGARPVRMFFDITLPIIRPALVVAAAFRALDALRAFDVIYVLTANDVNSMSLSVFARQQLADFQDVGYGSAAATLLFMLVAAAAALMLAAGRVRITQAGVLQ